MALHWDLSKIENHRETCFIKTGEVDENGKELFDLSPTTNALIWSTILLDIGTISEKTFEEFWSRLNTYQRIIGPFLQRDAKPYYITKEEVENHMGLETNIYSKGNKNKWYRAFWKHASGEAIRRTK